MVVVVMVLLLLPLLLLLLRGAAGSRLRHARQRRPRVKGADAHREGTHKKG